jgi:hypothetical protein
MLSDLTDSRLRASNGVFAKGVLVKDHTRELTFPAVVGLLQDGEWHADGELTAVTTFPQEWLAHLEHEGFELERQGESVRLVA